MAIQDYLTNFQNLLKSRSQPTQEMDFSTPGFQDEVGSMSIGMEDNFKGRFSPQTTRGEGLQQILKTGKSILGLDRQPQQIQQPLPQQQSLIEETQTETPQIETAPTDTTMQNLPPLPEMTQNFTNFLKEIKETKIMSEGQLRDFSSYTKLPIEQARSKFIEIGYKVPEKEEGRGVLGFTKDVVVGGLSALPKQVEETGTFIERKINEGMDAMFGTSFENDRKAFEKKLEDKTGSKGLGTKVTNTIREWAGVDPESMGTLLGEIGTSILVARKIPSSSTIAKKLPQLKAMIEKFPQSKKYVANIIDSIVGGNLVNIASKGEASDWRENALYGGLGVGFTAGLQLWSKFNKPVQVKINELIEKGIRPTVVGRKGSIEGIKKFNQDTVASVNSIIDNKAGLKFTDEFGDVVSEGKLPGNLKQFGDSIKQVKSKIYDQYSSLSKGATEKGITNDVKPIVDELRKLKLDRTLEFKAPGLSKYIDDQVSRLDKLGALSPKETEEIIQSLNNKLQAFYKNPDPNELGKNLIDNMIANSMRKGLDDTIEKTFGGAGYQNLKNQYGSLRNIEKDVNHRAIVDARKSNKGLLDFTDIFSAGDVMSGILTMQPGMVAKGLLQSGIKEYFKFLNNPNTSIKKLFKTIEGQRGKSGTSAISEGIPTPKTTFPALPSPKATVESKIKVPGKKKEIPVTKAVSKDIEPLYQEARKYKSADEFVENIDNDNFIYHGTTKKNVERIKGEGLRSDIDRSGKFVKGKQYISFSDKPKLSEGFGWGRGEEGGGMILLKKNKKDFLDLGNMSWNSSNLSNATSSQGFYSPKRIGITKEGVDFESKFGSTELRRGGSSIKKYLEGKGYKGIRFKSKDGEGNEYRLFKNIDKGDIFDTKQIREEANQGSKIKTPKPFKSADTQLPKQEISKIDFDKEIKARPVEKLPEGKGKQKSIAEIKNLSQNYNKKYKLSGIQEGTYVRVFEAQEKKLADLYEKMPSGKTKDKEVIGAYGKLAKEVNQQFNFIQDELGVKFMPRKGEGQPYRNSTEMANDVTKNKRLFFFTGGEPHPLLGKIDPKTGLSANDKFRAIHDVLGHASEGYVFGVRGEKNAWLKHSQMFSEEAQRALSTETIGQNSWVHYGKHTYNIKGKQSIPLGERQFAEQKVFLFPKEFTNIGPSLAIEKSLQKSKEILDTIKANGGISYDVIKGTEILGKPFLAVSLYPNKSKIINVKDLSEEVIERYIRKNADYLGKEGHILGAWKDGDKIYLDISIAIPKNKKDLAVKFAKKYNQKSIFDLESFDKIQTHGSGKPIENMYNIENDLKLIFSNGNGPIKIPGSKK